MTEAEKRLKANIAFLEQVFGAGSADLDTPIEELAEFYVRWHSVPTIHFWPDTEPIL